MHHFNIGNYPMHNMTKKFPLYHCRLYSKIIPTPVSYTAYFKLGKYVTLPNKVNVSILFYFVICLATWTCVSSCCIFKHCVAVTPATRCNIYICCSLVFCNIINYLFVLGFDAIESEFFFLKWIFCSAYCLNLECADCDF